MTRWLALIPVSALLAGTFAVAGVVKGAWVGLLFFIFLYALSRVGQASGGGSLSRRG